jgi:hypothetical protein
MTAASRMSVAAALVAAAVCVSAASAAAGGWPKVTHLRGGSTVSVWSNGRVVERSASGATLSESSCGSYARYVRWVGFMTAFRTAVLDGDRAAVAAKAAPRLLWNHGSPWRSTPVAGPHGVRSLYASIFVLGVVHAIHAADPRALFCKDVTMVMLGSGVAWGDEPGGRPAIVSINEPA